jgi:hypothetical protein
VPDCAQIAMGLFAAETGPSAARAAGEIPSFFCLKAPRADWRELLRQLFAKKPADRAVAPTDYYGAAHASDPLTASGALQRPPQLYQHPRPPLLPSAAPHVLLDASRRAPGRFTRHGGSSEVVLQRVRFGGVLGVLHFRVHKRVRFFAPRCLPLTATGSSNIVNAEIA